MCCGGLTVLLHTAMKAAMKQTIPIASIKQ